MRVSFGKFIPVDVYMNTLSIPHGKRKPVETDYHKLGEENFTEQHNIIKKFATQMSYKTYPKDTALTEQQRIVFRANNPSEYKTPQKNSKQSPLSDVISTDIAGQKYIVCGQQDVSFVKGQQKELSDKLKGLGISYEDVVSTPYNGALYKHRAYAHKKIPYEKAISEYMNAGNKISDKKLEIYATQENALNGTYCINFIDFVDEKTKKPIKFAQERQ